MSETIIKELSDRDIELIKSLKNGNPISDEDLKWLQSCGVVNQDGKVNSIGDSFLQ
jgi:hypothetical protein